MQQRRFLTNIIEVILVAAVVIRDDVTHELSSRSWFKVKDGYGGQKYIRIRLVPIKHGTHWSHQLQQYIVFNILVNNLRADQMALETLSLELTNHLKQLYHAYRHTKDINQKGNFFSSVCHQVCRPQPSFAARNRETIVRYLHESADKGTTDETSNQSKKGYYTIRPLREDEFEFGTDEQVAPAGFATVSELKQKAETEGWVGMRVDLWDVEVGKEDSEQRLIKVHYWWRKEEDGWIQILHDILSIGPRDGTEGSEGDVLE